MPYRILKFSSCSRHSGSYNMSTVDPHISGPAGCSACYSIALCDHYDHSTSQPTALITAPASATAPCN